MICGSCGASGSPATNGREQARGHRRQRRSRPRRPARDSCGQARGHVQSAIGRQPLQQRAAESRAARSARASCVKSQRRRAGAHCRSPARRPSSTSTIHSSSCERLAREFALHGRQHRRRASAAAPRRTSRARRRRSSSRARPASIAPRRTSWNPGNQRLALRLDDHVLERGADHVEVVGVAAGDEAGEIGGLPDEIRQLHGALEDGARLRSTGTCAGAR